MAGEAKCKSNGHAVLGLEATLWLAADKVGSCSDNSSVPGVNRNDLHQLSVLPPPLAQKNLNANLVGQQNVLLPPQAAADAFDAAATACFAMIRHNGLESRTLATLRDVLLPQLLSGQLRLPVKIGNHS